MLKQFTNVTAEQRALDWLTTSVERAKKEPYGVWPTVADLTPALAGVLLGLNPENRVLVGNRLEQIKSDLMQGRWILNGESIIVSDEGTLNDGQHRAQAVVDTNVTAPAVFVFGPPRPTRLTVDQGTAKRPGDYVHMRGETDGGVRSSVSYMLMAMETVPMKPLHSTSRYFSKGEMLEYSLEHRPEIDMGLSMVSHKAGKQAGSRSLLVFCAIMFSRRSDDPEAVQEFMRRLITGTELEEGSPILVARNKLANKKKTKGFTNDEKFEVITRAWNQWRQGRRSSSTPVRGNRALEISA
jgi:hypothetical protein